MVMDDGPYPFGRTVLYLVPAVQRIFKSKQDAVAANPELGVVLEVVETWVSSELVVAYRHTPEGETCVMDMAATDEVTAAKYFPGLTGLGYGRYGDLDSFTRGLEEFKALWELVKDSELNKTARIKEGRAERAFVAALRRAGRSVAYKEGGYVAMDELHEMYDKK